MRLALVIAIAACTHAPEPAKAPPPPPPPADARPIDAPVHAAPPDAAPPDAAAVDALVRAPDAAVPTATRSCPKHYADVAATSCSVDEAWQLACKYPDGHCECVIEQPCAGWAGAYEEARKHPHAVWKCTPKRRADGCPGDMPKIGSHCAKPGQRCEWGSCGGQVLSCTAGAWKLDHVIGPPP